ncbi:MAG: hypothetical protein II762_09385, partial [Ruminococcus sp.]|nr:hypothetical protein [Ruminococcus sp.]
EYGVDLITRSLPYEHLRLIAACPGDPADLTLCSDAVLIEDFTGQKLIAMYTSTDGLYTSFGSEFDFLDYHTIITDQLSDIDNFKKVIINNLTKRAHFGTEDDISLSCVYDKDLLGERSDVIRAEVEANKKRAAERKAERLKMHVETE